jgi:hypothetical protein
MRSGPGRQPHPTHGERVRGAVGVGCEDAARDLGRRIVVGGDRACGRVDAFNGGVEHRQNVWTRSAPAIHQTDDLFIKRLSPERRDVRGSAEIREGVRLPAKPRVGRRGQDLLSVSDK